MSHVAALLLDLDGTLYRGSAPLLAYAEAMAERADPGLGDRLVETTRAFLADGTAFAPYRDPWATVSAFGGLAGLDWPRRDAAFEAVRAAICRGEVAIEVPDGLGAFVTELERRVRLVVLTNSQEESARRLLVHLGLGRLAESARGGVGKPKGFASLARALLDGLAPERALSVGDNQTNDIAPALALGLGTVHVRWPGAESGLADHTVARLEDAYGWIDQRLAAPRRPAVGDEEAWA